MTDQQFRQTVQRAVAKLALGIKLTITEKKQLLRWRAFEVVNRDKKAA